jgi:tripartite-type tricarboxylate transporter receptor subunit TctC
MAAARVVTPRATRVAAHCAATLLLCIAGVVHAQNYPTRPLRVIVPFPPGGGADFLARVIGPRITESWGQSVIVDNRGGGSGIIGVEIAARAAPDGHTLLFGDVGTLSINPYIFSKLPYDPARDFHAVTKIADNPLTCAAHPALRAGNLRELIAAAKNKTDIRYASAGTGSMTHLAAELIGRRAGVNFTHVPFKGGGLALNALLANQVNLVCMTTASVKPHVQAGRLTALAMSTAQRSPAMPDLPTVAEQGFPGYESTQWVGLLAPRGTPPAILARLHGEFVRILNMPEVRERLSSAGAEPAGNTPAAFAAQIRNDGEKYGKLAAELGIKLD